MDPGVALKVGHSLGWRGLEAAEPTVRGIGKPLIEHACRFFGRCDPSWAIGPVEAFEPDAGRPAGGPHPMP